jgi:hypothetical protein
MVVISCGWRTRISVRKSLTAKIRSAVLIASGARATAA